MEKHPLHIKTPELQTSPEVARAVGREERQTGETLPNDPGARIESYMDRLETIFLNPDEHTRQRNIELFRDKIYDSFIIKPDHFPESYFDLQKRIARERGQAVEEIPPAVRRQMMEVAIEDQKASLDAWIDYLTSGDAVYPAWFKYYVWKNITKLSQFDKERGEFKKRTDTTVAPFPDIYREPLAQIADIYEKVKIENKALKDPDIQEAFSKKFPTLYAELIQESLAASMENREEIKGEWKKYEQGKHGDAEKLFVSLEGKGTGWCTAGRSTAQTQVQSGDFYVYYTNDVEGEPTQPRLAIRMEGDNKIGEVRGILPHQGVEPIMQEVLDTKLHDFGGEADTYRKKSNDMRMLTSLEQKYHQNEPFTKEDLILLYEINGPIEGFGYQKDPRIAEIRSTRNVQEDLSVIFDCRSVEIATDIATISESTKVYAGAINSYDLSGISPQELRKLLELPDIKLFDTNEMKIVTIKQLLPQTLDYQALKAIDRSKVGEVIVNPESVATDWESIDLNKIKSFECSEFVAKPRAELGAYIARTYGEKYVIPDLTYREFLLHNPDKIPSFMKDGNYYYFYGSVLRNGDGLAYVPNVYWIGGRLYGYDLWLDNDWNGNDRVLLLEK